MLGKTHRVAGAIFGTTAGIHIASNINTSLGLSVVGLTIASSVLGSEIPDIDSKNSIISKKASVVGSAIRLTASHRGYIHYPITLILFSSAVYGIYETYKHLLLDKPFEETILYLIIGMAIMNINNIYRFFVKRKFSITNLIWTISSIFYLFTTKDINKYLIISGIGLIIGYSSHLFLDMLTKKGIKLFAPLSDKSFSLLRLTTGQHEWVGIVLPIILCGFITYMMDYSKLEFLLRMFIK